MNELPRSILNKQECFRFPNIISCELEPLGYLVLRNVEPVTTVLALNADNACFSVPKSIR